jgi:hypothetical protein
MLMQLPFTHGEFLDLFGAYNRGVWPVVAVLWLATVGAVLHLPRGDPRASRLLSALLALHWAWAGGVYHIGYFRRINPIAILFGAVFLLEAALLCWRGVVHRTLVYAPTRSNWNRLGYLLISLSLVYPVLGLLSGLHYPRLPTFGIPCPSTLLTMGLLLFTPQREARLLGPCRPPASARSRRAPGLPGHPCARHRTREPPEASYSDLSANQRKPSGRAPSHQPSRLHCRPGQFPWIGGRHMVTLARCPES